jgi:hypothetical protein
MSYKVLQLSPRASTRVTRTQIAGEISWRIASAPLDIGFPHSWFEGDPDLDEGDTRRHINWGAILGLGLSIAVSASFWVGIAWMVERISR